MFGVAVTDMDSKLIAIDFRTKLVVVLDAAEYRAAVLEPTA